MRAFRTSKMKFVFQNWTDGPNHWANVRTHQTLPNFKPKDWFAPTLEKTESHYIWKKALKPECCSTIKMNEMPLQFSNMGLFGPNYIPLINSGFVLIEMFLTVRHVSNYSQKWWFSLKNSFSSGKIYLDNFIEQKDPICEVCKRRAVSALQGTFGPVDNKRPFDEGRQEMASKEVIRSDVFVVEASIDIWRNHQVVDSQTRP